ncbi:MAG: LacI family DNA-binding transcriptional regulator [Eubacteriales bacterium]|nr:LacI family DNA-binding transcriptional regulator [Eubacteriales bacterium]
METKDRLSVKDIAELAGTSVATVSRVINQNGRFSKATEARVRKVMEEYNFQPNQLARGLRKQHTQVIGIMVPDIANSFFISVISEIQKVLTERNYMTLICSSNENSEIAKKQIDMLLGQKVSGLIYIGETYITDTPDIPTVYIDRDPRNSIPDMQKNFELIESDNIQGGYLAGKELAKKGVKNATYICFNRGMSTVKKRLSGFISALEDYGVNYHEDHGVQVETVSLQEGYRATEQLLREHPETDGIFYLSDKLAIGGLEYLSQQNIAVPEQIKVIGFDGIEMGEVVTPRLTTIRQSVELMGRTAAERILEIIETENVKLGKQRMPVELVVRGTT